MFRIRLKIMMGYWPPLAVLADTSKKLRELAREINQKEGYKNKRKGQESLKSELGDLFFDVVCSANIYNIDLNKTFKRTIKNITKESAELINI